MTKFELYNEDNAPEASKSTLTKVKGKFGFIPNLAAGMAKQN